MKLRLTTGTEVKWGQNLKIFKTVGKVTGFGLL